MVKTIKKIIVPIFKCVYRMFCYCIPIHNKTILFIAFHGRGYLDNPMALHQYLIKDPAFKDYRFVWAIKNKKQKNMDIENAKVIEYRSITYFYFLAKSKYWISNCKLPEYIIKKKQQVYLQTWHGTPLKRLAHDIIVPKGTTFYRSQISEEKMHQSYDKDVERYTYMISPSCFTTEVFQSAFQIERERLIETGYPRNDCLSTFTDKQVQDIKDKYHLPKDKKILLYAPTWRDNSFSAKGYTFSLSVDFSLWKEILGEEYIVLFKPHYLIVNSFDKEAYKDFVYFMDATSEISELYIISDVLVTDYSSVFFDYAILKRPMYFYMYDLASYQQELRGFYIDIYKDLPGRVIVDEKELLTDIKNNVYDYGCLETFNQRFNNQEDGNASKRVVDIVFK